MKAILDLLRAFFISPEFLYAVIVSIVYLEIPSVMTLIVNLLTSNVEAFKFLPTLNVALVGISAKLSWKLHTPQDSNKTLYQWPDYYKVRNRALLSTTITSICTIGAVLVWIFGIHLKATLLGLILFLIYGIPLIVVGTQFIAAFTIREYLEKYQN